MPAVTFCHMSTGLKMTTIMVRTMEQLGHISEKTNVETATDITRGWITNGTHVFRPKTFRREGVHTWLELTSMVPTTIHLPTLSLTLLLHFIQVVRSELGRGPPWNICILQTFRYLSNSSSRTLIQQANGLLSGYHRDLQHQATEQTPVQATQRVHRELQG